VLAGKLLANDIGVASVLQEPALQPLLVTIKRRGPTRSLVRRPSSLPQVAPNRVPRDPELFGNAS
jgi:hypothetical protein